MTLYIDTTDFNKITFALSGGHPELVSGSKKKEKNEFRNKFGMTQKQTYKIDPHESHKTLEKLDEFLKKSKILNPKSKIVKIVANKGPGSYTGVRVGVTLAMALGFAWGVPVKALPKEKFEI